MGVGWVEIFWTIFHRPLKNPAITLDDATFFGETNKKKNGKAFPGPKTGIVFPTCFSTLEKLGNQIVFPIFGICWRRIPSSKLVSQFQSPYFQGKFLRHFKNAVPHGWQAVAAWSSDWSLSNVFGIYHHPWTNGNPFSANQVTRIKIRFLKQSVDKRDDRLRALKRNIIDLESLSFI